MEKIDIKWVYAVLIGFFAIFLLIMFKPNEYEYIIFAITSALLAYGGFIRKKNMLDKISVPLGIVLFLVFVLLYFVN